MSAALNSETAAPAAPDPVAVAREYQAAGWRIVPVPRGEKGPRFPGWPSILFRPEECAGQNVGVILGPVSGDLVDIDIDSRWALELAPYFLPPTLTFGRASKPRSHWLYICPGARSKRIFFPCLDRNECVEIRAKNASSDECGHQSVFPGSVHTSGEIVRWEEAGPDSPVSVRLDDLAWAVTRLATAALICDGHTPGGQRNNRAMAYAGSLCHAGWSKTDIQHLFASLYEALRIDKQQSAKDLDAVKRTIENFENGASVTSAGTLVFDGIISEATARTLQRIARSPQTVLMEAQLARSAIGGEVRERLVAEARATDAAELSTAAELVAGYAGAPAEATESRLGRVIDLRVPPARLDFLCEGLGLAPGKVSVLSGFSSMGKGPFMSAFALCAAAGKPFLGHHIKRSRVVLLDFETGPLLEWRLARLARGLGIDLAALHNEEWLTCLHARPPIDNEYLQLLDTAVEPESLVCVDSYTSAVLGEQRESSFANVAFALGAMSDRKRATFFVIAHERKKQAGMPGGDLEAISGHAAFSAAMQTAIGLRRPNEQDANVVEVRCLRSPIERFKPFQIRWADVSDPAAPPAATVGARARARDWGLRPELLEKEVQLAETPARIEYARHEEIAKHEYAVLALLKAQYPNCQAAVRDIERACTSTQRMSRSIAIRNLVSRGAVKANYHWRDTAVGKRAIWLSYPGAEAGVDQS